MEKRTGSNKGSVPINRTVSSNWNRVQGTAPFSHPKPKKKPRYPYRNR